MRRRLTALALVLMLLASSALAFSDVGEGDWYYTAVRTLIEDGVLEDRPDRPFQGDAPVTRAEFLALVLRAAEIPFDGGEGWQEACAGAAGRAGLLAGEYPADALALPISRYEAAEILWRAMGGEQPPRDVVPKGGDRGRGRHPRPLPARRAPGLPHGAVYRHRGGPALLRGDVGQPPGGRRAAAAL